MRPDAGMSRGVGHCDTWPRDIPASVRPTRTAGGHQGRRRARGGRHRDRVASALGQHRCATRPARSGAAGCGRAGLPAGHPGPEPPTGGDPIGGVHHRRPVELPHRGYRDRRGIGAASPRPLAAGDELGAGPDARPGQYPGPAITACRCPDDVPRGGGRPGYGQRPRRPRHPAVHHRGRATGQRACLLRPLGHTGGHGHRAPIPDVPGPRADHGGGRSGTLPIRP